MSRPRPILRLASVAGAASERPAIAGIRGRARGHDLGAAPSFETIFAVHHGWVGAMAGRLSGRSSEVDDIVQDVFFLCARKIATIPTLADAKPWLRTVTVRVVRKRLRQRKWRSWFVSSEDALFDLPYLGLAPDEHVMLERLYAALEALPLDERLAWTLRHVEGASLDEVATSCDCSLATAKRRIAKAAQALQRGEHLALQD